MKQEKILIHVRLRKELQVLINYLTYKPVSVHPDICIVCFCMKTLDTHYLTCL